jgi:hypothetical protein
LALQSGLRKCGYSSSGWPSGGFAPRASMSGASAAFLCAWDRGVPERGDGFAHEGTTPSTRLLLEQAASRVATISIPTRRSAAVATVMLSPFRSLGTARLTARYNEPYVGYFCDRDNAAARPCRGHHWQACSRRRAPTLSTARPSSRTTSWPQNCEIASRSGEPAAEGGLAAPMGWQGSMKRSGGRVRRRRIIDRHCRSYVTLPQSARRFPRSPAA